MSIDNLNNANSVKSEHLLNLYTNIKSLPSIWHNIYTDKVMLLKTINYNIIDIKNFLLNKLMIDSILDSYYLNLFLYNNSFLNLTTVESFSGYSLFIFVVYFINKILKITLFIVIIYCIFFITNFENYIKQINYTNSLAKFFILNESEKEVGPVDDFFFFVILFILTLFSFIFISVFFLIIQTKILIWTLASLILIAVLILTIPVNLFLDFGISFFVYIRGSASSGNYLKEAIFDLISTATVFIRFVIQNIRFLFIFSAIFELLEWIFSINSNIFINIDSTDFFFNTNNYNILIVNCIMFVILYFYYTLHLLFLLLVQITIYIGISAWLFFFLYSTKFLGKNEKFFIYKKLLINEFNKL